MINSCKRKIKKTMETAVPLKVPNKVNYKKGPNWGTIKIKIWLT